MKQQKLHEAWYLQEGDEIEINNKKFTIIKIDIIELYHKGHENYAYEKTFKLSEDYFLEFGENGIELRFGKIKKLGSNTFSYSDNIKINSIKILKRI